MPPALSSLVVRPAPGRSRSSPASRARASTMRARGRPPWTGRLHGRELSGAVRRAAMAASSASGSRIWATAPLVPLRRPPSSSAPPLFPLQAAGGLAAARPRRPPRDGAAARSGAEQGRAASRGPAGGARTRGPRARMQGARYRARNGVARARSVAFGMPAAAFFERYVLPWMIARGGGVPSAARLSGVVGGSSAGGPDWLSSLPDCLLHTIMSSLKARQAVQTCVLSTRWRHLWRSVPCLDIDFDEFNNKAPPSAGDDSSSSDIDSSDYDSDGFNKRLTNHKDWEHFEDFAATLMSRCNITQLDSFRLHIDRIRAPVFSNRLAAGWLRRTMKYCTPDRASKLGLSSGSWCLKRLHLCHVLLDDHFVKHVSSGCRSLEDLELDNCSCQIQSITSQSLKTLVLKKCRWHSLSEIISPALKTLVIDGGSNTGVRVLVILAPALAYLHLAVDVSEFRGGVSLNEVPSVGKAFIRLWGHRYFSFGGKLEGDQFKLLCSISNSTNLELSSVGTKVLGMEPKFQEFKNLRNLLLDNCDLSDDFKTLVFFLRGSPILEKVALWCCEFPKCSSKKKRMPKRNNISSSELRGLDLLCENLKVEIIYNVGHGPHLIWLLQRVSVNLSKNNIKLTKVN